MATRFRGFLPVVIDVETGGFDAQRHALLEIAAVIIRIDDTGMLQPTPAISAHVLPFPGAALEPEALAFNGIEDPWHPFREALPEREALEAVFLPVRRAVRASACTRAILVGHNAPFDLGFLQAAVARTGIKRNPFHPFSTFDTVTLSGVFLGQTVLAKAAIAAGLPWDNRAAHSAGYDAEQTARLFCELANRVESPAVAGT
jgi:ribonuclease T